MAPTAGGPRHAGGGWLDRHPAGGPQRRLARERGRTAGAEVCLGGAGAGVEFRRGAELAVRAVSVVDTTSLAEGAAEAGLLSYKPLLGIDPLGGGGGWGATLQQFCLV